MTIADETILEIEQDDGLLQLTLNRPDSAYALSADLTEALLQATRDPAVTEAMAGVMGSWNEMLDPRLSVAQERGVVRDDIPAERLTPVLASFLDGFLIQRMADPGLDATTIADTLVALLGAPGEERT